MNSADRSLVPHRSIASQTTCFSSDEAAHNSAFLQRKALTAAGAAAALRARALGSRHATMAIEGVVFGQHRL